MGSSGSSSSSSSSASVAMKVLCLSLAALALVAGVLRHSRRAAGTVRIAVLSDTHVAGPEYSLGGETGLLDNTAITRTQQRLYRAVRAINAADPPPQLALFGGDVVHNGLEHLAELGLNRSGLKQLLSEPVNGYRIAQALLHGLDMPQLYVWGNHDGLLRCGDVAASASKALAAEVYRRFFHAKPYAAQNLGRHWKVVALNAMYGYTWEASDPRCNPVLSSYGEEQLHWLDGQLAEGRHTLVMTHFPLATSVLEEVQTSRRWRDLRSVLTAHTNVRLLMTGHFHKGLDWEGLYPFPTLTLPAVRYSSQNYFLLDMQPDGSIDLLGLPDKNRGGARCSDWWTYRQPGGAQFRGRVEGRDAGDCGLPAAGEEEAWPLSPVLNRSSIPSIEEFNPEGSCRFVLWTPFLEACSTGASADCCQVLASQTRLSSSAPFATCLCRPSFYQASVEHMQHQHGVDLAATVEECVAEHGSFIAFRGGPLTWCPGAA